MILPAVRLAAVLETTRITISDVGLIGGGQRPLPGEVSLVYHGILFLHKLPEWPCHVLEVL